MVTRFHHFTTIVPVDIDGQLEKLETWYECHGGPIYTLNHSREFEVIRAHLPDWVVPVERRFPQSYGRDFLPFTQILSASREFVSEPDDRILLVNSDISLANPDALIALKDPTTDLVFASRLDVTNTGHPHGRYELGYDVFSLKRTAADVLDMPEIHLGIPWWDYVLPLSAVTAGYRVKRLDTDAFHHVLHPQRWSMVSFDHIGWKFMQRLLPTEITGDVPSHDRVDRFAEITNTFLNGAILAGRDQISPEEARTSFMNLVATELSFQNSATSPVGGAPRTQNKGQELMENAAFSNLLEQVDVLRRNDPVSVQGGHLDLGPDLWLSTDPAGRAEMSVAQEGPDLVLSLSSGNSGAWACLGMRISPDVLRDGRYLGLLAELDSDGVTSFTPTLRYFPESDPLVDVPTSAPVVLTEGRHTHLVHIPLDKAVLDRATTCELNLFFHTDTMRVQVLKLEPVLIR